MFEHCALSAKLADEFAKVKNELEQLKLTVNQHEQLLSRK